MSRKKKPNFTYSFVEAVDAMQFYKDMRRKHPTLIMDVDDLVVKFSGVGSLGFDTILRTYADEVARDTGGKMVEMKYSYN